MIGLKKDEPTSRCVEKDPVDSSLKKTHLKFPYINFLINLSLIIIFWSGTLSAETLYFPRDNLTLQDAVNVAAPGDTIIVAPGIYQFYYDNLTIFNKSLTLKSSHGPQQTILLGRGKGAVVNFVRDSEVVLDGFTITSVTGPRVMDIQGGGVYCAPTSAPVIINNVITGNEAVLGGGIFCDTLSTPVIENNDIVNNRAAVNGGGVFSYRSSATIVNNIFRDNEAVNSGGAIASDRDRSRINNNIIWKNKAGFGGGISCDRAASIIANNTIVLNSADYGGGIVVEKGSVRLTNLILWHNTKNDLYLKQVGPSARPTYSLIGDGSFRGVNGNILEDPTFANMEKGDFHLLPGSPAIDTGNMDSFYMDIDGSYNDMGAYGGPDLSRKQIFSDKD